MLDRTEREELIQTRIKILQQKLEKQRLAKEKRPQSPAADYSCAPENPTEGPLPPKRTRKSNKEIKIPDPHEIIGKRVEHTFMVAEEGKKRRQKLVYTGTITAIDKEARNPLYTMFQIVYDIDECENEDGDEEEVETSFEYELLADYVNGDLVFLDNEDK